MNYKCIVFCCLIVMLQILCIGSSYAGVSVPDVIRIGLYYKSTASSDFNISSTGGIEVGTFDGKDFEVIEKINEDDVIKVEKGENKYSVYVKGVGEFGDEDNVPYFRALENDNGDRIIKLDDKEYRGDIEVKRLDGGDMTVINVVSMQEYLYGVVPREIGGNSPYEAVKAQAIVARTYATKNYNKRSNLGFNLYPTVDDQAYGGYSWENSNSNRAVDETIGRVVTYNDELINGYYFSTSGGSTEDSENVWGGDLGYLQAVLDPYEPQIDNKTTWEVRLTADEIKERLAKYSIDVGNILNIQPVKYSDAGRVLELEVVGSKGTKVITKSNTRTYLGLNSQWYTVNSEAPLAAKMITEERETKEEIEVEEVKELKPLLKKFIGIIKGEDVDFTEIRNQYNAVNKVTDVIEIKGRGWGHAVGMSQNGAKGMANNGFDCEEIIKWYYTGVEVSK